MLHQHPPWTELRQNTSVLGRVADCSNVARTLAIRFVIKGHAVVVVRPSLMKSAAIAVGLYYSHLFLAVHNHHLAALLASVLENAATLKFLTPVTKIASHVQNAHFLPPNPVYAGRII